MVASLVGAAPCAIAPPPGGPAVDGSDGCCPLVAWSCVPPEPSHMHRVVDDLNGKTISVDLKRAKGFW